MTSPQFLVQFLVLGALLVDLSATVHAATLTEHMDIECRQPKTSLLRCDYRILSGVELVSVVAEHAGINVQGTLTADSSADNATTAVMFLVDTSDPARDIVVAKIREAIARMIDAGLPRHVFGLARFDAEPETLCALGCSGIDVVAMSKRLFASGKKADLYHNILAAIKHLIDFNAKFRHIILLSDGLVEDRAYDHDEVVKAARNARIVISSIGYPRSIPQSAELQSLRRLSEETGGHFVQANAIDYEVPLSFFARVMSTMASSGHIEFDLDQIQRHGADTSIELSLAFQTTEQNFLVRVAIAVSSANPNVDASTLSAAIIRTPPPEKRRSSPMGPSPERFWPWFWYGLPAMVFSAILIVALLYAAVIRRRLSARPPHPINPADSHAFLILIGNGEIRHKIDHTPWRIGRSRSNDLTLHDSSVSRLHAEIWRDALGQFTLQDLDSLNGVFVNDKPVKMADLDEKDRVDIGDVHFIFTLHDEDYVRPDPSVMMRTRPPT